MTNNKIPKIKGSKPKKQHFTSTNDLDKLKSFSVQYDKIAKEEGYLVEYREGRRWNEKGLARYMECKKCGSMESRVGHTATSVICSRCVSEMVAPPEFKKRREKTGRPRGWKFMNEFVDKDGTVFFKGIEQPELKGTMDPTEPKPKESKRKLSKGQKHERRTKVLLDIRKLKKSYEKARWKKDKKQIMRDIKKLERELKKL